MSMGGIEGVAAGLNALRERWLQKHQNPPTRLFYYTGAKGFEGIITTRCFWVTDIGFVNDPREARAYVPSTFAKDAFGQIALNISAIQGLPPDPGELSMKAWTKNGGLYVICFSAAEDDLPQWRGYGCGGKGYCLEVSLDSLRGIMGKKRMLRRVLYARTQYEQFEQNALELRQELETAGQGTRTAREDKEFKRCRSELDALEWEFAVCCKRECFAPEKEWRVLIPGGAKRGTVQYRFDAGIPTPYVKLCWQGVTEASLLVRVWLGGCGDQDLAKAGTERFLRDNHLSAEVTCSQVILR